MAESVHNLGVITQPQMVKGETAVRPLATVAEIVCRRAAVGDGHSEGVVLVGVGDCTSRVRQEANITVPVVAVETGRPGAADKLAFADALQAVGIRSGHSAVPALIPHLCQ